MHIRTLIFSQNARKLHRTFFRKFINLAGLFYKNPITSLYFFEKFANFTGFFLKCSTTCPDVFIKIRQPGRSFSGILRSEPEHF